ncbi:FG-GAP-like repeat-containing protein [Bizionia sp. KMM 8389]
MKTLIKVLTTILIYTNVSAQFGSPIVISDNADYANSVVAADIDGDGDKDVLSASSFDDKIAWYENIDGQGTFSAERVITLEADFATSVHTADLDSDGDLDAYSSSLFDNKIAWYENTDGLGNFGPQIVISTDMIRPYDAFAADIDGDGDIDIIGSSEEENTVSWFENTDGQGSFGPEQIITVNVDNPFAVYSEDIDGDGDMDVISASARDDKIAWFENTDGLGNFSAPLIITTSADGAASVYAVDIDGDGDVDVLSASSRDNKVSWYENEDGLGDFGIQINLTSSAGGAHSVYAEDIDGDGDMDVISGSWMDDTVGWYENLNGLGSFSLRQIISSNQDGVRSVYAADLNGDGNTDVLSASIHDDTVAWFEFGGVLGNPSHRLSDFILYPVPSERTLTIECNCTLNSIRVYDSNGRLVLTHEDVGSIDISLLTNGIYFVELEDDQGNKGFKKVIKK